MKNEFPSFRNNLAHKPHLPKNIKVNTTNPTKKVEFKRRAFEFKASTMENKTEKFNKEISFNNPANKEMFLFVDKISWELSKALNGATITITVNYPNGLGQALYNSRKIQQLPKGVRNINLTYSIQKDAEIKINFECTDFEQAHPNYFIVYKWLDPDPVKKAEDKTKSL